MMKKNIYIDKVFIFGIFCLMLIFILILFSFNASASIQTGNVPHGDCYDMTSATENNHWTGSSKTIDDNTATKETLGSAYYGENISFSTVATSNIRYYGIQINCSRYTVSGDNPAHIWVFVHNSSGWYKLYDGVTNAKEWTVIEFDPKICDGVNENGIDINITHNSSYSGREQFDFYEIEWLRWEDSELVEYAPFTDYPIGVTYGLFPNVDISYREQSAQDQDYCAGYLYVKNDIGNWVLLDSDADVGSFYIQYDGSYFDTYRKEYWCRLNYSDGYVFPCTGQSLWYEHHWNFTIYPSSSDIPFPSIAGLDNLDCWECISLNCSSNISIYNSSIVFFYNVSIPSNMTDWNSTVANGSLFNGLFWYNSTANDFDNVTWFEPLKGYWVYFYDTNFTIGSNITCSYSSIPDSNRQGLTGYPINATYDNASRWWFVHFFCGNYDWDRSKTYIHIQNKTAPYSVKTWNTAVSDGLIENFLFWYDESTGLFENKTEVQSNRSYWVYVNSRYAYQWFIKWDNTTMFYGNFTNSSDSQLLFFNYSVMATTFWQVDISKPTGDFFTIIQNHSLNPLIPKEFYLLNCTGECGYPYYINFSDGNVTVNITITGCGIHTIDNATVNDDNWLLINGFSLEPQVLIILLISVFFFFAEKKEDVMLAMFTSFFSMIGGFYFLTVDPFNIVSINTWAGLVFMMFALYSLFVGLNYYVKNRRLRK